MKLIDQDIVQDQEVNPDPLKIKKRKKMMKIGLLNYFIYFCVVTFFFSKKSGQSKNEIKPSDDKEKAKKDAKDDEGKLY